ncbi:ATP-grasp domain-containing protein [Streptomyces violascens]|uniref:ATP-grasp domain-containing protein n=1 Tax=Streptomyces violascens TaxID=67381 RepID=UPI00365DD227
MSGIVTGAGQNIALLVGGSPSAPYSDLLTQARDRGIPVLVPATVAASTPEVLALVNSMGVRWEEVSEDLVSVGRAHGLDTIVTFDELFAYECLAATVQLRGSDAPQPKDKLDMRLLLNEQGLSHTRAWELASEDDIAAAIQKAGTIVVKPRRGVSSCDVVVAHDVPSWRRAMAEREVDLASGEFYAEEFHEHLPFGEHQNWYASYLSVDVLNGIDGPVFLTADRKKPAANYGETGALLPSRITEAERAALQPWAAGIAALWKGLWPAFHIEFVHTAQGFQLIEVNPRLGGHLHVLVKALSDDGDLIASVLDTASGGSPQVPPLHGHASYFLVHPPEGAATLKSPPDYRSLVRRHTNVSVAVRRKTADAFDSRSGTLNALCGLLVTAPDADALREEIDRSHAHIISTARFSYGDAE